MLTPPHPPLPLYLNLKLNGTISESLLILPSCDVKWRGCGGKSNYESVAEEQSRGGNRCLTDGGWRVEGDVAPSAQRRSTRFSQSRAAWRYQPFHQPLNARPCLLTNTHTWVKTHCQAGRRRLGELEETGNERPP